MEEIWKDIKGYEGLYQVSNLGRVRSLAKRDRLGRSHPEKIKSTVDNGGGYLCVNLKRDGRQGMFTVHRLVAQAFLPIIEGKNEVNHLDGNKKNNLVDNLQRCNRSENMKHAAIKGLCKNFGQRPVVCVELNKRFNSIAEAEKWLGLKGNRISAVCNLKRGCKTCGGFHWRYCV